MKFYFAPALFFVVLVFSGCKKASQTFNVNVVESNAEKLYGSFIVSTNYIDFTSANKDISYSFYMNFNKSPLTELADYPSLNNVTVNQTGVLNPYNQSTGNLFWSGNSGNRTSVLNSFIKFNFNFSSPELGNCSYTEADTLMPYYSFQFTDTVRFSKSAVNTFTLFNHPANFSLTARLDGSFQGLYSVEKTLYAGNNVVKFYPQEVAGLTSVKFFILQFLQRRDIHMNGRRYNLTRAYTCQYYVVWTP